MPDRAALLAWYGTEEPVPERRTLSAGPLTAVLEAGGLRDIRFAGVEVLRAVAYVVRDRDWGTYAPAIQNLVVDEDEGAFRVSYTAACRAADGATLRFHAEIKGDAGGRLDFEVEAEPDGAFETNRTGFCVLHPILGLAGQPVTIEHVDGSRTEAAMPDLIEPWQPFKAIRAITHTIRPGLSATCRLEGDTFEMEDQRAWSDASYKTYVRPLALPWPYSLPSGDVVRQAVRLCLDGDRGDAPARLTDDITIDLGEAIGMVPGLGLVITPEETTATLAKADALAALAPQSLLFHFDRTADHDAKALNGFADVRRHLSAEAVLEYIVPEEGFAADLHEVAAMVEAAGLHLDAIAVSPSVDRQSTPPGSAWPPCPPLSDIYAAARQAFPTLRLGGGMVSTFTELNRKRPPLGPLDFVTHATCPIVHAADDRSVMQTLEALPFITRSTRAIIGDKPYRIGPATIGMRQNPYGSRTMDNPDDRRICMAAEDPRQHGLFAATWMIGYAAAVMPAGLQTLTAAAFTGPFGLVDADGRRRPAFHAARALASLAGRPALRCTSSHPDRVLSFAARDERGSATIWLANLTDAALGVALPGVMRTAAILDQHAMSLNEMPGVQPVAGVLTLPPYAIARCT